MSIDPSEIQLNSEQQAFIACQSERTGTPWPELLQQFVPVSIASLNENESALDVAGRLGLVGVCENDPPDLATNPVHMTGFGKQQ